MGADRHAELLGELERLAGSVAERCGVELVEVSLRGSSRRRLLRVDIDRPGPGGVTLDDCQRVSQVLGEELERVDPIRSSYVLEVSSPGVDRPLRTEDDFRRNTGRRLMVVTAEPLEGRRQFRGLLLGVEQGWLTLELDARAEVRIPLAGILKARQDVEF